MVAGLRGTLRRLDRRVNARRIGGRERGRRRAATCGRPSRVIDAVGNANGAIGQALNSPLPDTASTTEEAQMRNLLEGLLLLIAIAIGGSLGAYSPIAGGTFGVLLVIVLAVAMLDKRD